jgi:hypothetical protein
MENTIAEEKMILISKDKDRKKGGLRTMPFIIGNLQSLLLSFFLLLFFVFC